MKYLTSLFIVAVLGLASCREGPAEEFGEDIDNAATDAANAVEDACEDILDAADAERRNC